MVARAPLLSSSRAPVRHRCAQREVWSVLASESLPIETLDGKPLREEELSSRGSGCFRSPAFRTRAQIALRFCVGAVFPHAAPAEGALRTAPATVPGAGDETRLLMPWLGRTSTFVSDPGRLALTNEADGMARLAEPRGGTNPFPLAAVRPQCP